MKYAVPFLMLAGPALAHDAAVVHAHGSDNWMLGAAFLALFGIAAVVRKVRS